ncbi:oxidoreductase [Coprinopsis cinerea okayama7|uniref:Oxidoreductase n=1 Tax=Coprinopsis cinerea (strain Okayama-7 / 130 / ATCC MYA-4618 / FGSC 9003) TaxID=240176 RepID=A8NQM5_COPC7|nr:oxidoreductase [Coprinopsis cinerea okayama7\|eukprot:XP_001835630.2 oxidoreductase [Coprinopsis cinerea okayama7\
MTDLSLKGSATNPWRAYLGEIYFSRKPPHPLGTVSYAEIERQAEEKLKDYPGSFAYAGGSAGTNSTNRANLRAFERFAIIPRMLRDATHRTLETTLFGRKFPSPLLLAPIGVQGIFHADAELAPARAAKNLNIPYILSTAASRTIEEVAEANADGERWFQLYWPRTNEVTRSLLNRAKAAGYHALVVTLDTTVIGWRPHDLDRAYLPFSYGVGVQVGLSDPVFMGRLGKQPITESNVKFPHDTEKLDKAFEEGDGAVREMVHLGIEWMKEANSGIYRTWEDLAFLRENWEGPIVLKGIQSVDDAEKALNYGVDGILVSNHGGRQVDGAIPSLYALENIMKSSLVREAQASGKITILFDSGIRTGSDIIKAIALGAQGVLLGRPYVYGSVLAGQAGVEQVIKHTLADLDTSLGLSGYKNLNEIQGKASEVLTKLDL